MLNVARNTASYGGLPMVHVDRTPSTRLPARKLSELMSFPGTVLEVERDAEIVAQSSQTDHCMQVLSGCVRTFSLLEDGRRQIAEFLFPGDLLRWEAFSADDFGAEAVTPVTLRRIPHKVIEERANSDLAFARRLRSYSATQMCAARARCILLGRKTATERVASFLLEMAARLGEAGVAGIDLPMSRTDIADYLGLTTETVCRSLTEMRQLGLIDVQRAKFVVLQRVALAQAGSGYALGSPAGVRGLDHERFDPPCPTCGRCVGRMACRPGCAKLQRGPGHDHAGHDHRRGRHHGGPLEALNPATSS